MIPYLGDFVEDDVVYIMFNTFTSDDPSASSTITNFSNADVHIHKDDGLTQRNNAAGITVSVNFDGITGSHLIKIDTNDNTVAGFWVTGADYFVRIEGTTVDAATINAVVGHFSIQNRFMRGTDSANTTVPDAAGVAPTAAEIQTQMEGAGSKLLAIEGDTNELQTDWVNGGRLDLLLDAIPTTAMRGTDGANTTVPDAAGTLASYDPPTRTEATADKDAIIADLLTMKKTAAGTYDRATDSLEAIRDRGDAAWVTGAGGSAPTVGEIRTEMEGAGTKLTLALADTNELQTDWVNGGRLDLILDRLLDVMEIRHGLSVNDVSASTTKFITTMAEGAGFPWERAAVLFTSGANDGLMRRIKAYNGTTKEVTIQTPLSAAPADGDTFVIPAIRSFLTPDIEDMADAVLDEVVEGTLTLRQIIRVLLAGLAGKSTGGGTTTLTFRDEADAKARITATVDANGNRTAITKDGT